MKRKTRILILLSIFLFSINFSLVFSSTQAAPTDSYYLQAGDWAIYKVTHNSGAFSSPYYYEVGHEIKIEILAVNSSYGAFNPGDCVIARLSNSSALNASWDIFFENLYLK